MKPTCEVTGKIIYRSNRAAKNAQRMLALSGKGGGLRPYQCESCGKWHLGHKGKPINLLFAWVAKDRNRIRASKKS